jgi:peptide/nickel transport system ATP-binding protein
MSTDPRPRSGELELHEVTVRYGRGRTALTALDRVSLTVPEGTVVGLVGESGSGKSTLARAAAGLVPLSGGRIRLDGADPPRPGRRPLQMVFQDPYGSLDPRMTVADSVAEALPGRPARAARRVEVRRLLELVDLDPDRAGELPSGLSGGQRQRVALARALAARPRFLLADEITSSLDASVQGAILNLVRDLRRRLGFGMLVISHNLAVVRYLSDVIAVMYLGRIVEIGPAAELLAGARHPYTRTLLAAAPRLGDRLKERPEAQPGRSSPGLSGGAAADRLDPDPPDPHHPPPGCHFHGRCPVGPLVHPEREICATTDPYPDAARRPHRVACHFADHNGGSHP